MRSPGFHLLLAVGLGNTVCAGEATTSFISAEISAKIRSGLPTFQPAPAKSETTPAEPTDQPARSGVLILPKVTVNERRLPRDASDHLMSRRDFKRKMENLYLDALAEDGPLNVLLNNFTIPLLSPSKAQRGRAIYTRRELDRLRRVNETSRAIAPEAAKKFKDELDNTHTTRPAGGLHNK